MSMMLCNALMTKSVMNSISEPNKPLGVAQKQKRKTSAAEYGGGSASGDSDALPSGQGSDDEADRLLRTAGGLLSRRNALLPHGLIEATRLKDANQQEPSNAVVQSVGFHPNGQLLMTAGLDKKIRLFQVDGLRNPKVQSMHLEDLPIHQAAFASGGDLLVASGRRSHFYACDLHTGKVQRVLGPAGASDLKSLESFAASPAPGSHLLAFLGDQGYLPLVSLKSRQWVGNLKMNGSVRSASFSEDGTQLLTLGEWPLQALWCVHLFFSF